MATITLGPTDGSIILHTDVAGAAARMGHRLDITFDEWTVRADVEGQALRGVEVEIVMDSLRVVAGSGGVTPLSPVDKQLIKRNAAKSLMVGDHPRATFVATQVEQTDDMLEVAGDLTIAGSSKRVLLAFTLHRTDGGTTVAGRVPVPQKAFGVKPYSLMMGALQVADEVVVEVSLTAAQP